MLGMNQLAIAARTKILSLPSKCVSMCSGCRATAAFAPSGPASKTKRLKNNSTEMSSPPQTSAALISYIKPLEIPYMAAITLAV
jgi:hypothetical protein